jgi:glutamine amidotransferase
MEFWINGQIEICLERRQEDGSQNLKQEWILKSVVIIDYGMGNIYSISSAVEYLGYQVNLSSEEKEILNADALILPGVGSFYHAVRRIEQKNLRRILRTAVIKEKIPLLGICLGMQLLAQYGTEDGYSEGLGFIEGTVERFQLSNKEMKIPHVGFAKTRIIRNFPLFEGIAGDADFYYTHSYRMICPSEYIAATANNGGDFTAAVSRDNVYGVQFHPELSQTNGIKLLKNFLY